MLDKSFVYRKIFQKTGVRFVQVAQGLAKQGYPLAIHHPVNAQRELHSQPGFSVIQVQAADFSNPLHPIDQGIAMDK